MAAMDLRKLPVIIYERLHRSDRKPRQYKDAYSDWREMLEKEGDSLDTANVSTPDHVHALAAMRIRKSPHPWGGRIQNTDGVRPQE